MKTAQIFASVFLVMMFISCGPVIYKSADFDNAKDKIKTLAILPFDVTIDMRRLPKGVTAESIKQSEQKTGYDIQNSAYSWFLKRQKDYTVSFQDVDKTNSLLRKAGIEYAGVATQDKDELCRLLGVDGVVSGKAFMAKPMSDGAAVAIGVLFGAWGTTNNVNTSLTLHDKRGELMWKYDFTASGSVGSSSSNLTNALMRNASRKFPFRSR